MTTATPEAPLGLRERKKIECRRAIAAAARELAMAHGVDGFTVEEAAERAGVSARTFFNYFGSKEEAIIGFDRTQVATIRQRLLDRPPSEEPLAALGALFLDDPARLEANAHGLATRTELVRRHPSLMPYHLAASWEIERGLVAAMAERLGVDPHADPYPTVVVAVAVAALRSTMLWWHDSGRPGDLSDHLAAAFATLAAGLHHDSPVTR